MSEDWIFPVVHGSRGGVNNGIHTNIFVPYLPTPDGQGDSFVGEENRVWRSCSSFMVRVDSSMKSGLDRKSESTLGFDAFLLQFHSDAINFGNGMCEELLKAPAEVVKTRFTAGRADDPVLGTLTPAIGKIGAFPAELWEGFVL
jgi:hypothetical protein